MAKLLSNATANRLMALLDSQGSRLIGKAPQPLDMYGVGPIMSFTCSLAGTDVNITGGNIWFSDSVIDQAAGSVTLSGATEYVYLWMYKAGGSGGFGHSTTAPLSLSDRWIWPLCYVVGDGASYNIATVLHHGDLFMFSPLR